MDPAEQHADRSAAGRSGRRVRWRLCAGLITASLALSYSLSALLIVIVAATATGAPFDPVQLLVAALPGWLVVHQTAISVLGAPLSVLPLLPTAVTVLVTAEAAGVLARRSRLRRPDQAWPVIAALALVHAAAGTAIALLLRGPVTALPVDAFLSCGLTAGLAAAAGLANRCGLVYLLWSRVDAQVWSGLRAGLIGFTALVGAGAAVLLVSIAAGAGGMVDSMHRAGGAGDAFGTVLLTVLYLPNAVAAGWTFAAGTGFTVGGAEIGPLAGAPGLLPDLPLLAVVPAEGPALWSFAALLLPPVVGLLVGNGCRVVRGLTARLLAVVVAAVVTALGALLVAALSGGALGSGAVSLHPGALGVATLCWVAVPAAAVVWFTEQADSALAEAESVVPEGAAPADPVPADPVSEDPAGQDPGAPEDVPDGPGGTEVAADADFPDDDAADAGAADTDSERGGELAADDGGSDAEEPGGRGKRTGADPAEFDSW
nr:DUF6350 family protein [Saccharopolyspora sp. HNM0983]